jgi:hypothetical protein
MKKLKVFYNGVYLKDVYPYATKWEVIKYRLARGIRVLGIQAIIALALLTSNQIGQNTVEPIKVYADKVVEVDKELSALDIPVLKKIIMCESGGKHYAKNGQVVTKANENGTTDIGIAQINLFYWGQTASLMKLDLTKEKDNLEFAKWLFMQKGDSPWTASSKCWNK